MGSCRPVSSGHQAISIFRGPANLRQSGVKVAEGRVTIKIRSKGWGLSAPLTSRTGHQEPCPLMMDRPGRWQDEAVAGTHSRYCAGALRRPRVRAQGHLGRRTARDPAFSSNRHLTGPPPITPTHSLLVFIFMFNKQYICVVQNSEACTGSSLPLPRPAPRPPRQPVTPFPGFISSIQVFLAYQHLLIYAGFLLAHCVLHFAFPS